jgi:alcohol dehydrogenase class IV
MRDYRGYGKARGTLLPSIGIPTTAGTGSEAQSYAIISDAETHAKMACGDPGIAFRVAILDPALTVSQPRAVTAIAGYDALSHAVESYVTLKATPISELFAREAWRLLSSHYERVLQAPDDRPARGAMLLGAHYAGVAIEQSMLGATHACANPLTSRTWCGGTMKRSAIATGTFTPICLASSSGSRASAPFRQRSENWAPRRPTCRPSPPTPPHSGPGHSIHVPSTRLRRSTCTSARIEASYN